MFLFKNVRGLLTHDKGRTYKTITDIFENTGYTIQKQVLNAWDYTVYHSSWDEIVSNEIFRQRDKSNNNDIGYFYQRIFQYV